MQHAPLDPTELNEVIVELSYNCNLSCAMCGFGKHVNPFAREKFLPFDQYKTILAQVGDRTKTIRLNGRGESTIHPDFVEILYYTRRHYPGLSISLFTNFSFRNQKLLQALVENEVQLFVSMDSPVEEELTAIRRGARYRYIVDNLEAVDEMPIRPFLLFTIQEQNLHRIADMAAFALDLRCHLIYNTIRRDEGIETFIEAVTNNLASIIEQFQKASSLFQNSGLHCIYPDQLAGIAIPGQGHSTTYGNRASCPALHKELCVYYDGTVTPCNMFNPYVYGNLFSQSLSEIWNGEERSAFLESHKDHYYCKNCANLGRP